VEYLERALETSCADSQLPLKKKIIGLVGTYLLLEDLVGDDYHPTHIIDLDQHLKFGRIMKTVDNVPEIE
jgi:hypothetical protein